MKRSDFEIRADSAGIYSGFQAAYHDSLVAPLDDMWADLADAADQNVLVVNGEAVGFCSVNETREILSFHLQARFENLSEVIFGSLIERMELTAALASTVDPVFLSLSLDAGRGSEPRALMFQHVVEPEDPALSDLRLASPADHSAAVAFAEEATGAPRAFLEPYFSERIDKGELLLHEQRGEILASGECRHDERRRGYAHLGIIVDRERRGAGLGTGLMHALVLESRRRNLEPLCSTEPENLAARRAIEKAGFRARHRVFRVALR